jgi:hypothetical protein
MTRNSLAELCGVDACARYCNAVTISIRIIAKSQGSDVYDDHDAQLFHGEIFHGDYFSQSLWQISIPHTPLDNSTRDRN